MLSWLIGWKEKAIALGLFLLTVLGYIMKIKYSARKQGREDAYKEVADATEKKKNEWKKIDDTPVGVDDALSRLRKRASRSDGNT